MDARSLGYQWRCHVDRFGWDDTLSIWIARDVFQPGAPCKVQFWKLTDFVERNEGDYQPPPTMTGPVAAMTPFLQAIVDGAWRVGIEPTALKLRDAENRTQRAHLDDMRAIVSKKLGVKLLLD